MGKQAHQYFFENAFMARPRQVDLELVCQAQVIAKEAFKAGDLQAFCRALAVLLSQLLDASLEQTALVLCVGRATVPRLQARLRRQCVHNEAPKPFIWTASARDILEKVIRAKTKLNIVQTA